MGAGTLVGVASLRQAADVQWDDFRPPFRPERPQFTRLVLCLCSSPSPPGLAPSAGLEALPGLGAPLAHAWGPIWPSTPMPAPMVSLAIPSAHFTECPNIDQVPMATAATSTRMITYSMVESPRSS